MVNTLISEEELRQEVENFFDEECLGKDTKGYLYFVQLVFAIMEKPQYVYGKFVMNDLYAEVGKQSDVTCGAVRHHLNLALVPANEERAKKGLPAYTLRKFINVCINRFAKYVKRPERTE